MNLVLFGGTKVPSQFVEAHVGPADSPLLSFLLSLSLAIIAVAMNLAARLTVEQLGDVMLGNFTQ